MAFINDMLNKYDNLWMLNEWREEGGDAGVIVGKKDDLRSFSWNEGCIEEWHHRLRLDQVMPEPSLNQNARTMFPPSASLRVRVSHADLCVRCSHSEFCVSYFL